MKHDLKYFKKFLDDPSAYTNREFYKRIKQWARYVIAHKNEFDYLKDDEWKEIRERVLVELERREDLREEFEELNFQFGLSEKMDFANRLILHRRWLAFMKGNKFEYEFTEEDIADLAGRIDDFERADKECQIAAEKLRVAKSNGRKSLEKLSDNMFEYYERTGKRPVLTALRLGTRLKGN